MPVLDDAQLDSLIKETRFNVPLADGKGIRQFLTFADAKAFFDGENRFWQQYSKGLQSITSTFNLMWSTLSQISNQSLQQARASLGEAVSKSSPKQNRAAIYSFSPEAKFLTGLHDQNPEAARAAYYPIVNEPLSERPSIDRSRDAFEGTVAACLFRNPTFTSSSLDSRITAFDGQVAEAASFRDEIGKQHEKLKQDAAEWITSSQATFDKVLNDAKDTFSTTNAEWTRKLQETHEAWQKELEDLRKTYAEKLRLEEPAKYWKELETEYNNRGKFWVRMSAITVAVFAAVIGFLVYQPPALFHESTATLGGVKGAVLVGAAISMMIYMVNLFSKLSTSAYHLSRDARERFQLTHVFLALIKEKVIEPKDREVIISALFSRADTGLLKYDSSPTIPTPFGSLLETLKK